MNKEKYCILENDGVALCVCKHRPCEQLKRLQAEYDDLQLSYAGCKTANTGLQELNQKLEQENEKLKQVTNESIIEQEKFVAKVNKLEQENERLKEEKGGMQILIDNYIALTEKYRQVLQEIREMATLFHSVNENKGLDRFKNNILAKINEVIGAE